MLLQNQKQAEPLYCKQSKVLRVLFLILLVAFAAPIYAQTSSSTLRGVVRDTTGAVIPSANVSLKSARTGAERKVQSNGDGIYVFVSVDPGPYTLTVEASNFKKYVQSELIISPSETKGVDVALQVGQTTETINISGTAAEEIKTETGQRSNTISTAQIDNLSLISRNSTELMRILPGVVAPDASTYQISGFGGASDYSVNGQRGSSNSISVDGSRVIDIGCNCGSIVSLNNDMVQEVTILTSNFAAEHGNSGVQISGTTKAGSRDFHGSAYSYVRHEALAANDRLRNYIKAQDPTSLAGQKPLGRFYYPGFTIGGPVSLPKKVFGPLGGFNENRDKLFFFAGFEIQRQTFGAPPKISNVPTLAQRNGDFRGSTVRIPAGFANAGQDAPNSNLAPYINPIGKALINLYPVPNSTIAGSNYISNTTQNKDRVDFKTRLDYKFSDNTNLFVRVTRETESESNPYGIWWGPSTFELPSANVQASLGRSVAVGLTKV